MNLTRLCSAALLLGTVLCAVVGSDAAADDLKPIATAEIKRDTLVNFEKEILPILSRNCLACHNGTKAENSLVLETPQTILKGGDDGPAVVPKHERRQPAAQNGRASGRPRHAPGRQR